MQRRRLFSTRPTASTGRYTAPRWPTAKTRGSRSSCVEPSFRASPRTTATCYTSRTRSFGPVGSSSPFGCCVIPTGESQPARKPARSSSKFCFTKARTEHDFAWIKAPKVHRLDTTTRERIHDHLVDRQGCADLFDLQFELFDQEYCNFSLDELAGYLEDDARFDVDRSDPHSNFVFLAGQYDDG